MFSDSQDSMEKEGRQRGKDVQEENSSVSRMVLAAKENRPQGDQVPSASYVQGRRARHGKVWVPFPAPSNLCVLGEIPGSLL